MLTLKEQCVRYLVKNPFRINFTCLPIDIAQDIIVALQDPLFLKKSKPYLMIWDGGSCGIASLIYECDPKSPLLDVRLPGDPFYESIRSMRNDLTNYTSWHTNHYGHMSYVAPHGSSIIRFSKLIKYLPSSDIKVELAIPVYLCSDRLLKRLEETNHRVTRILI
jgi:hypothetical protein